jgi:MFS family permease
MLSGWGLVNPLFAVFVTQQINGGGLELIGFCTAVYMLIRAFLQMPFARFIDSRKGEMDDFTVMAIGTIINSLTPFLYIIATKPVHVLLIQAVLGIGASMTAPAWLAIFSRHIDRQREAEEWGLYSSMTCLSIAVTGALGGFLAERFGFRFIFFIVGMICTFGSSFLFFVYQDLRMAEKKLRAEREH